MPYSYAVYTGNGTNDQFTVSFPYIRREHVVASVNYVNATFTWVNNSTIKLDSVPANATRVEVRRVTPVTAPLVDFADGSTLVATDLDTVTLQQTYINQEQDDQIQQGIYVDANGNLTAGNQQLNNLLDPTDPQDAATKNYVDTTTVASAGDTMTGNLAMGGNKVTGLGTPTASGDAATKGYADLKVAKAGDSMTGALAMGGNKVTGVDTPTASGDAATKGYTDTQDALKVSKAGDSMTGPLAMGTNKITGLGDPTNAQDAATKNWVETAATSPLQQFRSIFYGAYATDPAVDPYGAARTEGDLYFNTTLDQMRVFNGTTWQEASADATITRFKFTAAGGETSLSGNDDNAQSLTYNVGLEMVYLNGVLLTRGVDYVATTGSSITGLVALAAADLVEVVAFSQIDAIGSIPSANSTFLQSGAGAVQRTVDNKLKDVVSVKDFGAVGDGVTDDTNAIASAITAAAGNQVVVPPGVYVVNNAIFTNATGIHLEGTPRQTTFKRTSASGSDFVAFATPKATVRGITFDFNKANVSATQWGVRFSTTGSQVLVEHCVFKDNSGGLGSGISCFNTGGSIDATGSVTIQNCEISGCTWEALYIASKANVLIKDNYVHDNSSTGIGIRSYLTKSATNYSTKVLVSGNKVERNGVGISIGGFGPPYDFSVPAATYVTVRDNLLVDNGVMLGLQGHHVSCSNNQIYRVDPVASIEAGIYLNGRFTEVSDNYINIGQASWGIDIGGSSNCNVVDNTIYQLSGTLLNIGGTENCTVQGNRVFATDGTGICCLVYEVEGDGNGTPFPTITSGLVIKENYFYWNNANARGINLLDDAGGASGKVPTIIVGNQFFPSGAGSSYYAVYAVSVSTRCHENYVNGVNATFASPNGDGNLVYHMVFDTVQTSAGGAFAINSVITQMQNEHKDKDRILFVRPTNGGSGYTAATTLSASGGGSGFTGIPLIVGGSIIGVRVTNRGTGYTGSVTITATDPGGGSGATFTSAKYPLLAWNDTVKIIGADSHVLKGTGGANSLNVPEALLLASGGRYTLAYGFNSATWGVETNALPSFSSKGALPAASADLTGAKAYIRTDASNMFLVRCDGTNWRFADGSIV